MFSKVIALILSLSVVAAWTDSSNYSFESFVAEFQHPWTQGSAEWELRKGLFENELKQVRLHNSQPHSWKQAVNRFSAMTSSEKKSSFGRSKGAAQQHKPKHEKPLPADLKIEPLGSLPKSIDWRQAGVVSPVKDQGHCGSCWGFASTAVLESSVARATGLLFDLSVQQMTMCAPNPDSCGGFGGCDGSTAELAFDYVASTNGKFYQEYQLGYAAYGGETSACATPTGAAKVGIEGYVKLPGNNHTVLMNTIAKVGPVAINVDASVWHSYSSGIFTGCSMTENIDVNHVVVMVGYGEEDGKKYWLVRNSWSPTWGEKGYIRLERTDNDEHNCGIDNTPQDGVGCSGEVEPVKVCGACGAIYDSSFPLNPYLV